MRATGAALARPGSGGGFMPEGGAKAHTFLETDILSRLIEMRRMPALKAIRRGWAVERDVRGRADEA